MIYCMRLFKRRSKLFSERIIYMLRQAKQIHIYLYRKNRRNLYEFAIFQRSDNELWWQGISGGVEYCETIEEAARREAFEEAGIRGKLPLYRLESISYLPTYIFDSEIQEKWGKDIVVVPMYFFAMPFDGEIKISYEHSDVKWLLYEDAMELVYFDDQKTALWELKERLKRKNLFGRT